MRNYLSILFTIAIFALTTPVQAQNGPAPSPFSKVEQVVGTTTVTIEYSRPSMKERKIMGDLVPYGSLWRTGANLATKITFDKDVTVGGNALAAGSYAILTEPGATSWKVNFYEYGESGWNTYTSKDPSASVMTEPVTIDCTVESFLINIDELRDESASLQFIWENTVVPVPLGVM